MPIASRRSSMFDETMDTNYEESMIKEEDEEWKLDATEDEKIDTEYVRNAVLEQMSVLGLSMKQLEEKLKIHLKFLERLKTRSVQWKFLSDKGRKRYRILQMWLKDEEYEREEEHIDLKKMMKLVRKEMEYLERKLKSNGIITEYADRSQVNYQWLYKMYRGNVPVYDGLNTSGEKHAQTLYKFIQLPLEDRFPEIAFDHSEDSEDDEKDEKYDITDEEDGYDIGHKYDITNEEDGYDPVATEKKEPDVDVKVEQLARMGKEYDTKALVQRVWRRLVHENMPQKRLATMINTPPGTLSNVLRKPKPWSLRTEVTERIYHKLYNWLAEMGDVQDEDPILRSDNNLNKTIENDGFIPSQEDEHLQMEAVSPEEPQSKRMRIPSENLINDLSIEPPHHVEEQGFEAVEEPLPMMVEPHPEHENIDYENSLIDHRQEEQSIVLTQKVQEGEEERPLKAASLPQPLTNVSNMLMAVEPQVVRENSSATTPSRKTPHVKKAFSAGVHHGSAPQERKRGTPIRKTRNPGIFANPIARRGSSILERLTTTPVSDVWNVGFVAHPGLRRENTIQGRIIASPILNALPPPPTPRRMSSLLPNAAPSITIKQEVDSNDDVIILNQAEIEKGPEPPVKDYLDYVLRIRIPANGENLTSIQEILLSFGHSNFKCEPPYMCVDVNFSESHDLLDALATKGHFHGIQFHTI